MTKLSQKEHNFILLFLKKGEMQSSTVHEALSQDGADMSLVTVKRTLSALTKKGVLATKGSGRTTTYELTTLGRVFADVDAGAYISIEPDKRYGSAAYNFDLFQHFPTEIFDEQERNELEAATQAYKEKVEAASPEIRKKELERLIVELSWKSSKIEGNTYTLLDTENLLLNNKPALNKTQEETQMILNHKDAFDLVHENKRDFKMPTRQNMEEVHKALVKDMRVNVGLRKSPVGVSGSIYRPLDNVYQIEEALEALFAAVNRMESPYAKSCLALLGTSYIQPFEDGNKRTSRLMAGAILMAHDCAPLSYRSADEKEYREATLVFYELNSIVPFKKIFAEQYVFAANNYATA